MFNSQVKYQSILNDSGNNVKVQCDKRLLNLFNQKVKNNDSRKKQILTPPLKQCSKLQWSNPQTVATAIAFTFLLYLVTLSKINSKSSILPPFKQPTIRFNAPNTSRVTAKEHKAIVGNKLWKTLPRLGQLDDSVPLRLVEQESNLAATFWIQWKNYVSNRSKRYPGVIYCENIQMLPPYQILLNNVYWQMLNLNAEFGKNNALAIYLYNAYYDNRLVNQPTVKVVSSTNRQIEIEKRTLWCLLWFDQLKPPILSNVTDIYSIWPENWNFGSEDGVYGPQIITCALPKEYSSRIPKAVSIQEFGYCNLIPSTPSNILRVINNPRKANSKKPSIGVCVKALHYQTYDVSVRLIEWLEMIRLLGADKVYLYVLSANENIYRVLRHYDKDGLVEWRRSTLPGDQPSLESLSNYYIDYVGSKYWPQQLLELNDCLYRNMFQHDYLAVLDIDEVILPQTSYSWHQMLREVESKLSDRDLQNKAYYWNHHAYVYEMWEENTLVDAGNSQPTTEIADYLYTMRHTYRSNVYGNARNAKCYIRTNLVSAIHNHFPMRCLNTSRGHHTCDIGLEINPSQGILMHYRQNITPPSNCTQPTVECALHDRTAWRYFDHLSQALTNQLNQIFPSNY